MTNEWVEILSKHIDNGRYDYFLNFYVKINTKTEEEISKFEIVKGYACFPWFTHNDFIFKYDSQSKSSGDA